MRWQDEDAMALFDRIMAVNVRGVVSGIRHAAPAMAGRGGGAIVATASTSLRLQQSTSGRGESE
jgi:NAD(P)-dependent dehydrogenase (short-subunit alcohol dehydrogenase family)